MKFKRLLIFPFSLLLIFATTCVPSPADTLPTPAALSATPYASLTPITLTPMPSSTSTLAPPAATQVYIAVTASPEQLARWQEYERALAARLLFLHEPEDILCEWEILGESFSKIYVWAICLGLPPEGRSEEYAPVASIPVVIHLGLDGSLVSVELPRDNDRSYGEGIREIFPKDVQQIISDRSMNIVAMAEHAKLRRTNPGPPLIVLISTY
jgi:hypothetical protein